MKKVLFICTGNTCRSPMAQAIFNYMAKEMGLDVYSHSAGLAAFEGAKISRGAKEALSELGIDAQDHRAKGATKEMLEEADLIVAMTEEHSRLLETEGYSDKVFTPEHGVSDPYGGDLERYRRARDEIRDLVTDVLKKLGLEK